MLYAQVNTYGFDRVRIFNQCRIRRRIRWKNQYEFMYLWCVRTQPHLTTSRPRSHCRHLWLSADDINGPHMLSHCCWGWCGSSHVYLGLDNHRNLQFGHLIFHISPTEVIQLLPPNPVVSICHASSASAKNSLCCAVLFRRLCPSPIQVHHHHSACRAQNLLHHIPRLPHPAHHQNLQDHSDCHW